MYVEQHFLPSVYVEHCVQDEGRWVLPPMEKLYIFSCPQCSITCFTFGGIMFVRIFNFNVEELQYIFDAGSSNK